MFQAWLFNGSIDLPLCNEHTSRTTVGRVSNTSQRSDKKKVLIEADWSDGVCSITDSYGMSPILVVYVM
jgi:hypothetical protein